MNFSVYRNMSRQQWGFVAFAAVLMLIAAFDVHAAVGVGVVAANVPLLATIEDVAKELKSAQSEFKSKSEELAGMGAELKEKYGRQETVSKELKEAIDKAIPSLDTIRARVQELEQKLADNHREEGREAKSYGEQIVESDHYKGFKERGLRGSMSMELKVVSSTGAAGLIQSRRETEPVSLPQRQLLIRDLLNVVPISTSSVEYPVQNVRTNAAAPVAEQAAKPYSDYGWTTATVPVRTIAHLAKLTRQALDDAPRLRGEVDSEMRYGLGVVEEAQLLFGNNSGQNLHGIMPQATAFSAPITPTGIPAGMFTKIDVLRLAILQNALALWPVDGVVLNEADWADIELTKTEDGAYLFSQPQGTITPRIWGKRVVTTPAMTVDNFLVGNFAVGATLYDRMGVEVLISTENVDDFEKNMATMRAEERIALAVKRPAAFTKGVFSTILDGLNPTP